MVIGIHLHSKRAIFSIIVLLFTYYLYINSTSDLQYLHIRGANQMNNIRETTPIKQQARDSSKRRLSVCPYTNADDISSYFCSRLIAGDTADTKSAINFTMEHPRRQKLLELYPEYTMNCSSYIKHTGFLMNESSEEEKQFPIAFAILVYKDAEQVERLLRAIYRPHNVYCLHVDSKSPVSFHDAIRSILKCLPNALMPPRLVDVEWGKFSLLEAQLICMDSLLQHKVRWKYFINLTGQEYPLRTNYELVKILQAYRGANDIQGTYKRANTPRWKNIELIPRGIVPRKGSVFITASRDYIKYIRTNETALDILAWVQQTDIPDECFFSTINYNPQLKVPGSYKGDVDDGKRTWLTRFTVWENRASRCGGKYYHSVCVYGVRDLPTLTSVPHLFANKFHFGYQPLALDCLQNWYFQKVAYEQKGLLTFNTTLYERRYFITNSF